MTYRIVSYLDGYWVESKLGRLGPFKTRDEALAAKRLIERV